MDISAGTGEITAEDVECWKREYRAEHVIVAFNWGQANLARALRQLEVVAASDVTIDAYVWVAWTDSQAPLGPERVETVLSMVSGYPVRRLWLDAEYHWTLSDTALGPAERLPILRESVAACGNFPCGIYTRKNWWNLEIGPTTEFSNLPLWYARYDHQPNFRDWYETPAENPDVGPFGGWSSPTGKQYDSDESVAAERAALCTNSEIDWSVIGVLGADDEGPPSAPGGLSPNGVTVTASPVTVTWNAISGATEYKLEVEYLDGGSWRAYWSETIATNSFGFPVTAETSYRFKVAARNSSGWGPFSGWAEFVFDDPSVGSPPPAPTGLRPNGATVTASPVTVAWDAISGATEYQLEVEYLDGGSWRAYWTETRATNSFEFPVTAETSYRFKVAARNAYGWGPFSGWASFDFVKPGPPPPPPTNLQPNTVNITTSSVTLSVNPIPGVIEYEFIVYFRKDDAWVYYYTYQSDTNTQTFWPQIEGTSYRWLARARNQSGWGEWSYDAVFWFNP